MWPCSSFHVCYRVSLKDICDEIDKIRKEIDEFQQLADDEEQEIPVEVFEQLNSFIPVS